MLLASHDLYGIHVFCFVQIEWQNSKAKAIMLLQKTAAALSRVHQLLNFIYFIEITT